MNMRGVVKQGCGQFSEFWLFFAEQVFTLPLYCYEKGNQGAMNLHTKEQNEHTPDVNNNFFSIIHLNLLEDVMNETACS